MENILSKDLLMVVLREVQNDLARKDISTKHRAQLHHQLGTIYGLLNDQEKQLESWQAALDLDPQNPTFRESLVGLKHLK